MKKIFLLIVFVSIVVISLSVFLSLRNGRIQEKTNISILNGNVVSNVSMVNQNPRINVSINSNEKMKKFLADKFAKDVKLTIIISGTQFTIGKNDYWKNMDGSQSFLGGFSVSLDKLNPLVNLAVDVDTTKNIGWNESNLSIYLEEQLYSAVLDSQVRTTEDVTIGRKYYSEVLKLFPISLFKVSYVK